ncbi:sensor histidine kinase [Phocaeicola sartorii]|uniref:histidine kinase n=1 Tax=Phocaeicola sartorii TaxID=671267 RepID=A0A4V3RT14_9BACT|nr:HAMP domain-containing sensor histidine kinase [Phocaeicola sartorii]TGY69389.1 HAMP domain-containing histidine kinase [Phocaeicola sartorii]
MRKVIYIAIIAAIAMFCLQGLWIGNMYRAYVTQTIGTIENVMSVSIGKEIAFRRHASPYEDPEHPKIVYKAADDMTPEERSRLKGDTLDLDMMTRQHIGSNLAEMIMQFSQDDFIKKGKFVLLSKLDSIFRKELGRTEVAADCCILLCGKDTVTVINSFGVLPDERWAKSTRLFPIGTKSLQFIQVKADIALSPFLREMILILMSSILLVVITLWCVIYLVVLVRKKDKLFKQREASVNGTVHDLKAPLNSVITLMGYLKKKLPDVSLQKIVADTAAQTRNLVNDIEALLITARQDKQKIILQKTETDLLQLIEHARESISIQYVGKPHKITLESDFNEAKLRLDPLYVTNVIRNLLENALKYSNGGVSIVIKVGKEKNEVVLSVEDNGWGIERKYQKKIFTQFFQVPREEVVHQHGYGVGLAYTKYIMEAHGGSISVESEPGKGSTFICRFPVK